MRHFLLPFLLILASACPLPADEDPYDRIIEKFRKGLKSKDMDRRARAVDLLDANQPASHPELLKLLLYDHWFMRGIAAEKLSATTDDALRAELRLKLLTDEEILIREGIALAFTLNPVKGDADALSGALDDGAWEVRRTAALGLAQIISLDSIEALIGGLVKEADPRVSVLLADTLRKITGQNLGRDAAAWKKWWKQNREKPELKALEEEKKRRELGGMPLETVTVARRRRPGPGPERKKLPDILILAPFGWTHDVYRPYLDAMTRYAQVTYVNLPPLKEVTGQSGYGTSIPNYPVTRLVKALEKLRKELGAERVIILAEGATGWIAQRYAAKYKKHAAGLIILNGFIDVKSYAAALFRLARSPVPAERWVAQTLSGQNKIPHDRAAYRRITRIMLTADLADPSDSRGYLLWRNAQDPQGFAIVPAIEFGPHSKLETPTLFFFGARSRLTGFPERERIDKHFPNRIVAPLLKSRGFAYASEYDEFYRILEGFFEHYGLL